MASLLALVLTTAAADPPNGSASGGEIVAMFADASPLLVGNDVKVNGVPVGKVSAMDVEGKEAAVHITLDPSAFPLHRDAQLTIEPVSLLGERFIALDRGSTDAPVLGPGERIPSSQTHLPSDLDQILDSLGNPTGGDLAATVTTLGKGLEGNGRNADASLKALAPAMQDTGALVGTLQSQTQLLQHLVDQTEPVAGALSSGEGKNLDDLVNSAHDLLGSTADRQQALDQTIAQLPGTLTQARGALEQLTGVTRSATPTLQAMRPTTDNLSAISDELQKFSDAADPALASAEPVLDRADQLLAEARPVVADLKPAGPDLRGTAKGLAPVVNDFTDHLPGFWSFIQSWALTTNGHDGISHYFRAMVTVNTDEITHSVPEVGGLLNGNHTGPQLPGVAPDGRALPGILAPSSPPDAAQGGATGLDKQQENNAMSQLLGGG